MLILVGFEQQDMRYAFDEAIHVVAEPDGCRIISNTRQYLLHKVCYDFVAHNNQI